MLRSFFHCYDLSAADRRARCAAPGYMYSLQFRITLKKLLLTYILCRTGALPPSRSLDNDEWCPTNSSSLVTMFGLTRGLAMSFRVRASIVWADTAQRHQAPSDLYLPLPSSLMDELLAPRSQPSAVHTAAPRYTLSPYGGNRSQRNVNESSYRVWQAPECGSRLYLRVIWPQLLSKLFLSYPDFDCITAGSNHPYYRTF